MLFLTSVNPDFSSISLDVGEICLRLLCAMLIGLVIGTEREYTNRPAGMRTHILVALGACAVMITGQLIFLDYRPLGGNSDPARLSAQVITGVGFLGAGTILRDGFTVRGLTTAASLWAVACLGIAAGGGYYSVALTGMVFIFVTLTIFEFLQRKLLASSGHEYHYLLISSNIAQTLNVLDSLSNRYHCSVRSMQVSAQDDGRHRIAFEADFPGARPKTRQEAFLAEIIQAPSTCSVQRNTQSDAVAY